MRNGGLGVGAGLAGPGMCTLHVNGAVDGDAAEPEEDAATLGLVLIDPLQCDPEGVLEDVLCQLPVRQSGQDGPAVQRIGEPLEDHPGSGPVSLAKSLHDRAFFLVGRQVGLGLARGGRQGRLLVRPTGQRRAPFVLTPMSPQISTSGHQIGRVVGVIVPGVPAKAS